MGDDIKMQECKIIPYTAVTDALSQDPQRDDKLRAFLPPTAFTSLKALSLSILFNDGNDQVGYVLMYDNNSPLRQFLEKQREPDGLLRVISSLLPPPAAAGSGGMDRRYTLFEPFKFPVDPVGGQMCHVVYCDMLYRMHVYSVANNILAERFSRSPWITGDKNAAFSDKPGLLVSAEMFAANLPILFTGGEYISRQQARRQLAFNPSENIASAGAIFATADLDLMHSDQTEEGRATIINMSPRTAGMRLPELHITHSDEMITRYEDYARSYLDTFPRTDRYVQTIESGGGGMCFFHSVWDQLLKFAPDYFITGPERKVPGVLSVKLTPIKQGSIDRRIVMLQKLYLRDMSFVKFAEFAASADPDKFQHVMTVLGDDFDIEKAQINIHEVIDELRKQLGVSGPGSEQNFLEACYGMIRRAIPIDAAAIRGHVIDWYDRIVIDELEDRSERDIDYMRARADGPINPQFFYTQNRPNDVATYHDKFVYDMLALAVSVVGNRWRALRTLFFHMGITPDMEGMGAKDVELIDDNIYLELLGYKTDNPQIRAWADIAYTVVTHAATIIRASFAELCYARSYVGLNHVVAVSEGLQLNLFIYTPPPPNRRGREYSIDTVAIVQQGLLNCCLMLVGGGIAGHYTAVQFSDEGYILARQRSLARYTTSDPLVLQQHMRRYPFSLPQILEIKEQRLLLKARFCIELIQPRGHSHYPWFDDHLFIASTFSYFQHPKSMTIFFDIFFKLLTIPSGTGPCLLDRVRVVHKIIAKLLRNSEDMPARIALPVELGFLKNEKIYSDDRLIGLKMLIGDVTTEVIQTMYTATVLTAYFMYVPPVVVSRQSLNTTSARRAHPKDKLYADIQRSLATYLGRGGQDQGNQLRSLELFREKTLLAGIDMRPSAHAQIISLCHAGILYKPELLRFTAFYEFYSILMESMFQAIAVDNAPPLVSFDYTYVAAPMHPAPPPRMETKHMDVSVVVEHIFNESGAPLPQSYNNAHILAWFTKSDNLKIREYEHKGGNEFGKFMHGTRISFAPINPTVRGQVVTIPFEFDALDIGVAEPDSCLHLAVYVKQDCPDIPGQQYDVRFGHTFIRMSDIRRSNNDFSIVTWEGPISTRLALENNDKHALAKGMEFRRTYRLRVTLTIPGSGKRSVDAPHLFYQEAPNSLFTKDQMSVVSQFLFGMSTTFDSHIVNMHSLLYVNFPMENNVIPLWSVTFLPPFEVHKRVLANRLDMVLHNEGIDMEDFIHISLMAFKGRFLNADDQAAWMPHHQFEADEQLREFARHRFLWLFTQVINPFNKIVYRSDVFEGKGTEQMGYPVCGFADCEDTAEGVNRLLRGLSALRATRDDKGVYIILRFLSFFTPAMTVLTTNGASYTRSVNTASMTEEEEDRRFYDVNTPVSLHMMALLVPKHVINTRLEDVGGIGDACIPVETTGLNFNSYVTPEALLGGRVAARYPSLVQAVVQYNKISEYASKYPAVAEEKINFAVMINSESVGEDKGWSFIKPSHYFYGRFVAMCHDQEDADQGRFLDFFYKGKGKPGVRFHDVVNPGRDWQLRAPDILAKNPDMRRKLEDICRTFAANVQPIPNLRDGAVDKTKYVTQYVGDKLPAPAITQLPREIESLRMRSVCFFMNASYTAGSEAVMRGFWQYMSRNEKNLGMVKQVTTWSTLGGALSIYVLQVTF